LLQDTPGDKALDYGVGKAVGREGIVDYNRLSGLNN
jgi:hypothetical protein